MEMQLPFLAPAVGPSSVSLLRRRGENGKSRDHGHLSGGLCCDSSRRNSSYASQTHKTGHSYDCYVHLSNRQQAAYTNDLKLRSLNLATLTLSIQLQNRFHKNAKALESLPSFFALHKKVHVCMCVCVQSVLWLRAPMDKWLGSLSVSQTPRV